MLSSCSLSIEYAVLQTSSAKELHKGEGVTFLAVVRHAGYRVSWTVIVIVIANRDSTSSRLLPGSSYGAAVGSLDAGPCLQRSR
jgi:hypothetical protein